MRTTVTLDSDTEALVKKVMRDRNMSFKEAVNGAIRAGLTTRSGKPAFSTPTYSMGKHPRIDQHKALRLAGELEDDEIARKLAVRK